MDVCGLLDTGEVGALTLVAVASEACVVSFVVG